MLPVVPTPLPPGTPHFDIPVEYTIWGSVTNAITTYQLTGTFQPVIEAVLLVGLLIIGAAIVVKGFRDMTRKDAGD